jgi:signal transduction histidine kinase
VALTLERTKPDANSFTVRIENDGFMIPMAMSEKIFEPFFRIENTSTKPGTGIGLAICKFLAELHNGKIILIKSQNQTNIFELILPVHQRIEFTLNTEKEKAKY